MITNDYIHNSLCYRCGLYFDCWWDYINDFFGYPAEAWSCVERNGEVIWQMTQSNAREHSVCDSTIDASCNLQVAPKEENQLKLNF